MSYYDNYLEHHGILGQKWGVRRYQNKDGSLTEEGKKKAALGEVGRKTVLNEGKLISENTIKKGNAIGNTVTVGSTAVGTGLGALIGAITGTELAGNTVAGAKIGAAAGGTLGAVIGGNANSSIRRAFNKKAVDISNDYLLLAEQMKKEYGSIKIKDIQLTKEVKQEIKELEKLTNAYFKDRVSNAKKTGKYDMEFLERGLDLNSKTGEPLQGKALDDAYEKYLRNK